MRIAAVLKIIGVLLMLFSFSMLPPTLLSIFFQEQVSGAFGLSFAFLFVGGFSLYFLFQQEQRELKLRDVFLVVVLFWVILSFAGAVPFLLADEPNINWIDALFESTSGLTTTGASILNDLDNLPYSVLYYRQQLQFLGGMGIIVLAVAVLPMLGIGGMQMYQAELPGPVKNSKLTPRIAGTAKFLWFIYLTLFLLCCLAYWAAGMQFFDALGESLSTVATGGFSMHDASFAYYNNPVIELIATIFMFLSALNFALHFTAFKQQSIAHYWQEPEVRCFFYLLCMSIMTVMVLLYSYNVYPSLGASFIKSLFNVTSLATTTGLTSANFASWPVFIPVLMMWLGLVGGCAASTTGGVKIMRFLLVWKQAVRELRRLLHPNAILRIKFSNTVLSEDIIQTIWGFIAAFIAVFVFLVHILMWFGFDLVSSFGLLVACLGNVGVGIGQAASNYTTLPNPVKLILIIAMWAGRLELFTLLILFTPFFWRK